MTPTPEDYAQKVIDAVIDGTLNINKYQDVKKAIAAQIAAAVAAEHRATLDQAAKVAEENAKSLEHESGESIIAARGMAKKIMYAIRALP